MFRVSIRSWIKDSARAYDDITTKLISEVFEQLPIPDPARVQLKEIPFSVFWEIFRTSRSGSSEFFRYCYCGIRGKRDLPFACYLRYRRKTLRHPEIPGDREQKDHPRPGAYVIPFAQREMVDIFMSGIDPRLSDALVDSLSEIFHEYPKAIIDSIETMNDDEKTSLKTQFQPKSDELVTRISTYIDNYRASNLIPSSTWLYRFRKPNLRRWQNRW